MLIVVAPSAITASSTRHRKSGSRAVAVLGRELDVVAQVAREAHRQLRLLEHLLAASCAASSPCAAREVAMKVWMRARAARLERLGGARDVAVVGARQRADGATPDLRRRSPAPPRSRRCCDAAKPASMTSTPQPLELAGDAQLLVARHRGAGRLLAVAQGGVEDDELVGHVGLLPGSRGLQTTNGPLRGAGGPLIAELEGRSRSARRRALLAAAARREPCRDRRMRGECSTRRARTHRCRPVSSGSSVRGARSRSTGRPLALRQA